MKQPDLFGNPDTAESLAKRTEYPSWYTPSKYRRTANGHAMGGRHPFGLPLGPENSTCGDCVHVKGAIGGYRKCALAKQSKGVATDLVLRWRCCERFEEKTDG